MIINYMGFWGGRGQLAYMILTFLYLTPKYIPLLLLFGLVVLYFLASLSVFTILTQLAYNRLPGTFFGTYTTLCIMLPDVGPSTSLWD